MALSQRKVSYELTRVREETVGDIIQRGPLDLQKHA